MPMPKPTATESQNDWMGRCMHFLNQPGEPDRPQEQRVAICMQMWRDRGKDEADLTVLDHKSAPSRLRFPFEIKSLASREFEGYGSVFGNEDLGGDIVIPGAFAKTLDTHRGKGSLPQMFWMHDPSRVPGKWLDMSEDNHGLYVRGQLADTPLGQEMHTLMKMDAVRGLSIGYMVNEDSYDKSGRRLLKAVDLWETSLVSLAMNPLARVSLVKSQLSEIGEYVPTPREWEVIFRAQGCSKRIARKMVAKLFVDDATGATLEALESKLFGKDSTGGTLEDSRWDADDSELGRALDQLRDLAIAESIPSFR